MNDIFLGFYLDIKNLAELLTVGLDKERTVFKRVDKQLFGRVNNYSHVLEPDPLHHALINVVGHGVGNASRKNKRVAR